MQKIIKHCPFLFGRRFGCFKYNHDICTNRNHIYGMRKPMDNNIDSFVKEVNEISVEKIQPPEITEVATILTEAFYRNPAYSLIFKKKNQLKDGLSWLFRANLIMLNHKHPLTRVVKEKRTGKIIGTFTIIPPLEVKPPLSIYMKIGIPYFIVKFGLDPLVRMLQLDYINKQTLTESMETSLYYYLSMVVIKKEYRRTGIGTCVLISAIEGLIASNPSSNILGLTTQLPENVTFYSRLGFNVLDEGCVNYKRDRYNNWNMKLNLF